VARSDVVLALVVVGLLIVIAVAYVVGAREIESQTFLVIALG
jgi:hypothetical protein